MLGVGAHTHEHAQLWWCVCKSPKTALKSPKALSFHLHMGSGDWIWARQQTCTSLLPQELFHILLFLLLGHILSLFYKCKTSLLQMVTGKPSQDPGARREINCDQEPLPPGLSHISVSQTHNTPPFLCPFSSLPFFPSCENTTGSCSGFLIDNNYDLKYHI